MIGLTGENIKSLPFKGLNKISDLIYFDGPLLSHFKDTDNRNILFYWVDCDKEYNRWLLFETSEDDLISYLKKEKTFFSLIQNPVNDVFYTLEIGSVFEYRNIQKISKENLPSDYMPERDTPSLIDVPDVYLPLIN